ncbi:Berberine/berberine-like [Parasponia andersonii]|uniref:Berberine/berberine-like n=1 Tax=Parasponia andersonii TaxID=3476 RepID=A0A2P5A4L4_PARAD|nr:Berberine/berberine-like [Parasponia andersonii]
MLYEEDVGMALLQLFPYNRKMDEISESKTPFPHRSRCLYLILYMVAWREEGNVEISERNLDLGTNSKDGATSYAQASIWGKKYFGDNFERLVHVKTIVDPANFFKNEQSIPPLPLSYSVEEKQ